MKPIYMFAFLAGAASVIVIGVGSRVITRITTVAKSST